MAKKDDLKNKDIAELDEELRATKHEALNLRFRNATGQLEHTHEIKQARRRIARINTYIQENVTGMKEVQLFTREKRNFREFDEMNMDHRNAWFQSIRYDAALFSVVELAQNLTVAIIL